MLDSALLKAYMNGFFGYGDLKAPLWFVGMEEGGGASEEEIENRLNAWVLGRDSQVADLAEFHHQCGLPERFLEDARVQPTWRQIMRLILALKGREATPESLLEFQRNELGRRDGKVAMLELLPLPKRSIKTWPYTSNWVDFDCLPELKGKTDYEKKLLPTRERSIRQLIHSHEPKAVVFYGKRYLGIWESISGCKLDGEKYPFVAEANGTVYMLLPHPVAWGAIGAHYDAAATLLRSKGIVLD